jgi:hypothetical protein
MSSLAVQHAFRQSINDCVNANFHEVTQKLLRYRKLLQLAISHPPPLPCIASELLRHLAMKNKLSSEPTEICQRHSETMKNLKFFWRSRASSPPETLSGCGTRIPTPYPNRCYASLQRLRTSLAFASYFSVLSRFRFVNHGFLFLFNTCFKSFGIPFTSYMRFFQRSIIAVWQFRVLGGVANRK